MPGDVRNPRWLYIKAGLLLIVGLLAAAILLLDSPHWRTAALLAVAVWAFCRAYYFAFYVVQQYADPQFRFAGLLAFARYLLARRAGYGTNEEECSARPHPRGTPDVGHAIATSGRALRRYGQSGRVRFSPGGKGKRSVLRCPRFRGTARKTDRRGGTTCT